MNSKRTNSSNKKQLNLDIQDSNFNSVRSTYAKNYSS